MTLHQLHLICFAAGSVIHATQTLLVARHWRYVQGLARQQAANGMFVGGLAFFWQFGNLFTELATSFGFGQRTFFFEAGRTISYTALVWFPLLFSYMSRSECRARSVQEITRFGYGLRHLLWPWTVVALLSGATDFPLNSNVAQGLTLNLMLLFFSLFTAQSILERKEVRRSESPVDRANLATLLAAVLAAGLFAFMLFGSDSAAGGDYLELAAMMTSVPFTIAIGYQLYHFPFMDAFVRESLSGLAILIGFGLAVTVGSLGLPEDMFIFWLTAAAVGLAFAKEPVSRWVETHLMGYGESIDQQEERVGTAIRTLTHLDQFAERVSEILRSELDAQWVEIQSAPNSAAEHRIEIAAPSALWLSLGPRIGGRHYMSRHLRLARTAAFQLAAHHHQLSQHELRDLTARAQIRALQAQINPHFLFNTLNVLASLIHTRPAAAERVIEELAEIFRYALESTRLEWVKVEDEIHFLEAYLGIEKARFDERLTYSLETDEAARGCRIPPMILQPLVENAVKHGIGPRIEGGTVRLAASAENGNLVVVVEDNGVGQMAGRRNAGAGIGLKNVRERLQHIYGDSCMLRLEENEPSGTRVTLVLPRAVGVHP